MTKTVAPVAIVSDSREHFPYEFGEQVASGAAVISIAALPAGDYSVVGYESVAAIERKSLADYVSTVVHARERFSKELSTLSTYELGAIVVEATLEDVLEHRYSTAAAPSSVWGATISIMVDYRVPVYWCGTRPIAAKMTFDLLRRYWTRKAVGGTVAVKSG
jgi:DNA excision repair protein ERCC-4